MRQSHAAMLLRLIIIPILPICVAGANEPSQRPLRVVIHDRTEGLDPLFDATANGGGLDSNVYEPLVAVEINGEIVPKIAIRWERRTPKTWVFTLRPKVFFHDGIQCTSEDVVASILGARANQSSALSTLLEKVVGVEADGPLAVRIELRQPDSVLLEKLSLVYIFPRPTPNRHTRLIGTGPYRIDGAVTADSMHLRAFDGYWGERLREQDVEIVFDLDEEHAVARLLAGDADLVSNLRPTTARGVEKNQRLWVDSSIGSSVFILMLNTNSAPLSDPKIRQAVDCALDRTAIAREVFQNYARPAGQLVTSIVRGYSGKIEPTARDLARSHSLVAKAKNKKPQFTIDFNKGNELLARMVQAQLAEAGISVELRMAASWVEFWPRLMSDYTEAALFRWTTAPLDAGIMFEQLAYSASSSALRIGLISKKLDHLIEETDGIPEPGKRTIALQRVSEHIAERCALLPIVWVMNLSGSRRELSWTPRADGEIRLSTFIRQTN